MKKFLKTISAFLIFIMLLATLGGCQTGTDTPSTDTDGGKNDLPPQPASAEEGYYLLENKSIAGVDITGRFLFNTLYLSGGEVVWTEITNTGTETSQGTYTLSDDKVSVKIGLKTYEFTAGENFSTLKFQGKLNRKTVIMDYVKNDEYTPSTDKGAVNFTDELFGDDINENFYNYCPSVMIDGRTMHVWYCSNKTSGNVTDYVAYRKGTLHDDGKWTFSEKQLVLSHGEGNEWDARHVCDPSVVKGKFNYDGESYNYLMAYLGCITSDCTKNEVGIALAKSPEGPWVKPANINPIADFFKDYDLSRTQSNAEKAENGSWGYGQPSLVSVDKQGTVLLFYSVGVTKGTYTVCESWNLSDVNNPVCNNKLMVSNKGITNASGSTDVINNADFAYDPNTGRLYCIKEDFGYPTDNGINWIAGSNTVFYTDIGKSTTVGSRLFENYTYSWTMAGKIDSATTGYVRNHNCAIVTDAYGYTTDSLLLPVVYTMSMSMNDYPGWGGGQWPALHTYRLHGLVIDVEL